MSEKNESGKSNDWKQKQSNLDRNLRLNGLDLNSSISDLLRFAESENQHHQLHCDAYEENRDRKEYYEGLLDSTSKALEILQKCAEDVQSRAHETICRMVSRCLSAVFEDAYEFKIVFSKRGNTTQADISFDRNGEAFDPLNESSGGVMDVASLAIRVACLMLRPELSRILILDEPFKMISADHLDSIAELIQSLHDETGIQFIIITHHSALELGEVYQF